MTTKTTATTTSVHTSIVVDTSAEREGSTLTTR